MTDEHPRIGVFLLDDHEVVRDGVRLLVGSVDDIEVVGEAGTGQEAIQGISATRPDVAVLDLRLPDMTGVEVCREVRSAHPEIACLMLTSFADDEAMFGSIMAGASGYVLKQVRGTDLVGDIRKVARGHSLLDPAVVRQAMERVQRTRRESPAEKLTPQEERILQLIAKGLTNRQIGEVMYLSEKTVKNYVSHVLTKLGMARRTEAAVYAVRRDRETRVSQPTSPSSNHLHERRREADIRAG